MYVKKLSLRDYRNYTFIDLEFTGGVNIIVGPNAQGKTNLLESIYLLATGTSHRASRDGELVRWSADSFQIDAEVFSHGGIHEIGIRFSGNKKSISVDGVQLPRVSDLLGVLNVVLFSPDDLQLVKGAPAFRRRFINICLCRVSPSYRENLLEYERILLQRNNLLRSDAWGSGRFERRSLEENLSVWDEQLVRAGTEIVVRRRMALEKLASFAGQIHSAITSGGETLEIRYEPSFPLQGSSKEEVAGVFMRHLKGAREMEMKRRTTMVGPHRDDFKVSINLADARTYGSQGQQRTSVLSLKLAELDYLKDETGEYPVLLLDDVLSELDRSRRNYLLNFIHGDLQTFITTTDLDGLEDGRKGGWSIFKFEDGALIRYNRGDGDGDDERHLKGGHQGFSKGESPEEDGYPHIMG